MLILFIVGLAGWTALPPASDPEPPIPPPPPAEECGGAAPQPVKITLQGATTMPDSVLFEKIATEMQRQGAVNQAGEIARFNIVLVFGGTGGDSSPQGLEEAKDRAKVVADRLRRWSAFTDEYTGGRWSEHFHLSAPQSDVYQLTIFPLFCED
jgi:hypothetical protein